jgi:hypothetical protein
VVAEVQLAGQERLVKVMLGAINKISIMLAAVEDHQVLVVMGHPQAVLEDHPQTVL